MAPHSSTLAWRIPWTEECGRLQSMGCIFDMFLRRDELYILLSTILIQMSILSSLKLFYS